MRAPRMRLHYGLLTSVLLVPLATLSGVQAGEPVPEEPKVPAGSFAVVKYKLDKGDAVQWEVIPDPTKVKEHIEYAVGADGKAVPEYAVVHFNGLDAKYRVNCFVINFDTKKFDRKRVEIEIGKAPQPPPPVPPGPNPPEPPVPPLPPMPPPAPAKTFYVILIRETGATLTEPQKTLFNGITVENWLRSNTTRDGDYAGFRRHDKDDGATGDSQTFNELWGKVRSAITPSTVLPAVAIIRDGHTMIEPLHTLDAAGNKHTYTPIGLVALLDKYKQGK